MLYLGIDPGKTGGIAALHDTRSLVDAVKMPDTERDIWLLLDGIRASHGGSVIACIEKVNAGVFGRPGSKMGVVSAFTFGKGVGTLHALLTAANIPFDEVLPVTWQTTLQCRSRGDKNVTKRRAQQLFPEFRGITHATADALLIAEFCRRRHAREAATPATPARKELFDGKDEEHEEVEIFNANCNKGDEIEVNDAELLAKAFSDFIARGQRAQRAAQRTAILATGNGRPGHRRD